MNNKEKNYPNPDISQSTNVVSSTECTGVVRGLPDDQQHMQAFTQVCDIPEQGSLGVLEEHLDDVMKQQKKQ